LYLNLYSIGDDYEIKSNSDKKKKINSTVEISDNYKKNNFDDSFSIEKKLGKYFIF